MKGWPCRLQLRLEDWCLRNDIPRVDLRGRSVASDQKSTQLPTASCLDPQVAISRVRRVDLKHVTVINRLDEPDLAFASLQPLSPEPLDSGPGEVGVDVDTRNQAPLKSHTSCVVVVVDEIRVFRRAVGGYDSQALASRLT